MSTDVTEKGDNEHEIGEDIEGGCKRRERYIPMTLRKEKDKQQ